MLKYDIRTGAKKIKTKTALAISGATLGFTGLAMAVVVPFGAKAAGPQVIVTPTNQQGWSTADTRPGGAVNFVVDPTAQSNPNNGALQLTTNLTTTAKAQYLHSANEPLANVTELSYYTKQNSAVFAGGDPSYQLVVNLNGATGFTTFVYEPYQNGVVTPGVWQSWDVDSGMFWSSRTVTCSSGGVVAGGGGAPFYTLSQINTMCPNAVAIGFGVNIGSNNPGYDVEADLVNFNGTVYNFEPTTITVTINKYIDGSQATSTSANGAFFPMVSSWSDDINSGSGAYTLGPVGFNSPNPYEAVTRDMTLGADYSTSEVTSGPTVSTTCTVGGAPYALVGYTTGDTLAAAKAGTPSSTSPAFTDLQNSKYVIVWNKSCTTPTNKDQCKNGGWHSFNTPKFKNQGDCVSWFATNGRNPANG